MIEKLKYKDLAELSNHIKDENDLSAPGRPVCARQACLLQAGQQHKLIIDKINELIEKVNSGRHK